MRRYIFGTLMLFHISLFSFGQTSNAIERIAAFSRVWGYLKYCDPAVASGKLDWDSVFLNNLPQVIGAKTNHDVNQILATMASDTEQIQLTKAKQAYDSLFMANMPGTGWIRKSKLFESQLKARLLLISATKKEMDNKYIKMVYNTADFSGEKLYADMLFPEMKYRLLFLSRFWNIINYFAPYKYLIKDWDRVLITFIPKFIHATDTLSYYKTLLELCKTLGDGHAQVWFPGQKNITDLVYGHYTVPFYCEIISGKIVVRELATDSLANTFNIQQGDIILKIDGKPAQDVINYRKKYISASNYAGEMRQLSWFILDGEKPSVKLEIRRGNGTFEVTIARIPTAKRNWGMVSNYTYNDVGYKKLGNAVLLVYAMQIWKGNIDTIKQMITKSKAVIFDVRNYPQNDAFYEIVDPFLAKPAIIDYATIALPNDPGLFKWEPSPKIGQFNARPYKGKVVILADERTQSQGEYSVMVLQTIPNAVTIGRQTGGTDGVRTYIPMGGGINLSYSGYGIYYPDKRQTQRVGIRIDVPVKKTIKSITAKSDETLEKALKYIRVNDRKVKAAKR